MFFSRLFGSTRRHLAPRKQSATPAAEPRWSANAASDEVGRHGRRDALFDVVREAMLKAGALSSQFKFKVLTLNGAGTQFMVMLTLPPMAPEDLRKIGGVEMDITRLARLKHGISVDGVYWRATEIVTRPIATPTHLFSSPNLRHSQPNSMSAMLASRLASPESRHPRNPICDDELRALQHATTSTVRHRGRLADSGQILPTLAASEFADTDVLDFGEARPYDNQLSSTQYAGL